MKIFEVTSTDDVGQKIYKDKKTRVVNTPVADKNISVADKRIAKFSQQRDMDDMTYKGAKITMPGTNKAIAKAKGNIGLAYSKQDKIDQRQGAGQSYITKGKPVKFKKSDNVDLKIDEKGLAKTSNTLPDKIEVMQMPTPPQAPTPDTPDGTQDDGIRINTTKKGNRSVSGGAGTYIFTPKGKLMLYMTPKFRGYQQTHNLDKQTVTVNFGTTITSADGIDSNINQKATYDMSGKLLSRDNTKVGSGAVSIGLDKDKGMDMSYGSLSGKKFKFSSQDPEDVKAKKLAAFKQDGKDVQAAFRNSQNAYLKKMGIEPNK